MIQIFKKTEDESYQLIEEMQDDLALAQRLLDLRKDGSEYRAEDKNELGSQILDC